MQKRLIDFETGYEYIAYRKELKAKREKMARRRKMTLAICSICLVIGICSISSRVLNAKQQFIPVEITVQEGDTVWDLQKELTPNDDCRKLIFEAEKNAGMSYSQLQIGQVITLYARGDK